MCFVKVCVINEFLGEFVLFVVGEFDSCILWWMIWIKYGNIFNVSFVLFDSFELVVNLDVYEGFWECVFRVDFEFMDF